jgi:hypothetical protein
MLSDNDLLCDAGDLGLITRRLLGLRTLMPERDRFIRGVFPRTRPPTASRG